MTTTACKIEGCKRPYRAKGYCGTHFKKWRRGELPKKPRYKVCVEEGCTKPQGRFGRCEEHFRAMAGAVAEEAPAPTPAPAAEAPVEAPQKGPPKE